MNNFEKTEQTFPVRGDRVRDKDRGFVGTVTGGQRSGLSIAVTWDEGHPYTEDTTLEIFDDIEVLDADQH